MEDADSWMTGGEFSVDPRQPCWRVCDPRQQPHGCRAVHVVVITAVTGACQQSGEVKPRVEHRHAGSLLAQTDACCFGKVTSEIFNTIIYPIKKEEAKTRSH